MLTAGLKLFQTCTEHDEALAQFSKTMSCQSERLLVYLCNQAPLFSLTKEFLTMSLSQLFLQVNVLHDVSSPFQALPVMGALGDFVTFTFNLRSGNTLTVSDGVALMGT
jgi:hypothetical protein